MVKPISQTMEKTEKISTEVKILAAAEEVFLKSGYDGSRMQEIADLAGINKAMLHYYFRSKDLLFERIFEQKFSQFFPKIQELTTMPISFTEKVCIYKNNDFVKKMPLLLMSEFAKSYYNDLAANKVKELNPIQFLMSVMSMCVFPFLSKPILCSLVNISNQDFDILMNNRPEEIKRYVRAILTP